MADCSTEILKEDHPEIVLEEERNTPPKIYAVDPNSIRKALLYDLNPQFRSLKFAKVEEIKWEVAGHSVKRGLYYPAN
jgi:hypothetical protein